MEKFKNVLKAAHQESQAYMEGGVRVNDSFWYHVSAEYPGSVAIHLYRTHIDEGIGGAKAFLTTYKEGLNELADRLENDPALSGISTITGWSKLVYEHPRPMELLGFEVTERDDEKGEALAVMSRERFLSRPWIKAKTDEQA